MGLLGNLFEKKNCDVCGEEIKLLGTVLRSFHPGSMKEGTPPSTRSKSSSLTERLTRVRSALSVQAEYTDREARSSMSITLLPDSP